MPGPNCGCRTSVNTPNVIQWCPTHAAAPDLLELVRQIAEDDYKPHLIQEQARVLFAKVKGES
jgi:hypothetical protein